MKSDFQQGRSTWPVPASIPFSPLGRPNLPTTAILKGWKSVSPGLRGTSYPGVKHSTAATLKGLHPPSMAARSKWDHPIGALAFALIFGLLLCPFAGLVHADIPDFTSNPMLMSFSFNDSTNWTDDY